MIAGNNISREEMAACDHAIKTRETRLSTLAELMVGVQQLPFGRQNLVVLGSYHTGKTSTVQSVLLDKVSDTTSTVGIDHSDLDITVDTTRVVIKVRDLLSPCEQLRSGMSHHSSLAIPS